MVGCSRMWCPVVAGLADAAAGLAAVGVGLVVVEGKCPCLDGGSVVVGDGERSGLDGELLAPGDIVEDVVEVDVVVLVGGKELVVDMVVGPVVEEDLSDLGGVRMVVPVGVHLDLGRILGDVGVEEEEHGDEKEELVDMDGTWLVDA